MYISFTPHIHHADCDSEQLNPAAEKLYPISVLQYPQWLPLTIMFLSSFLPFVLYGGSCFHYAICINIHYFHIRWYSSCRSEAVTRRLPLVNHELLTLPEQPGSSRISCCSIFWSVYCFAYLYCIFVPFLLAIVLALFLRLTDSYCHLVSSNFQYPDIPGISLSLI